MSEYECDFLGAIKQIGRQSSSLPQRFCLVGIPHKEEKIGENSYTDRQLGI